MKVYQAIYFESKGVYFFDYRRIVVAESQERALELIMKQDTHTKKDLWQLYRVYTDEELVLNTMDVKG